MELGDKRHAQDALVPGKTRYTLYRRLGGPQDQSGRVRKISPLQGFDPRTVQPVASRYTDWAIRPLPKQVGVFMCYVRGIAGYIDCRNVTVWVTHTSHTHTHHTHTHTPHTHTHTPHTPHHTHTHHTPHPHHTHTHTTPHTQTQHTTHTHTHTTTTHHTTLTHTPHTHTHTHTHTHCIAARGDAEVQFKVNSPLFHCTSQLMHNSTGKGSDVRTIGIGYIGTRRSYVIECGTWSLSTASNG